MQKYPQPSGQQPVAPRRPFRGCGLKFCRLFMATAKTSSPAEGGGSSLPPNPRYLWVRLEQCCSAAGIGGVSSSVWRPSLSGFIAPSVIANGASSLPVSFTPLAGQRVSTVTSNGPAIRWENGHYALRPPNSWGRHPKCANCGTSTAAELSSLSDRASDGLFRDVPVRVVRHQHRRDDADDGADRDVAADHITRSVGGQQRRGDDRRRPARVSE